MLEKPTRDNRVHRLPHNCGTAKPRGQSKQAKARCQFLIFLSETKGRVRIPRRDNTVTRFPPVWRATTRTCQGARSRRLMEDSELSGLESSRRRP